MSLASELFETGIAFSVAEGKVHDLLVSLFGEDGYNDFTHDYYDESIEVYGCVTTGAAWDALRAAGFRRIWLHQHDNGKPDRISCGCTTARPA